MDIQTLRDRHPDHWMRATAIRALTLDAVAAANSGHSGMPMGMADVATVLFANHLKFDASAPRWPDRDRFILSAGHGSMLLYSLMYLTGYPDMTLDQVKNFRQWGAITAGHPEYGHVQGVETTTGPLGQGISNAVGFAMAEESLRARWGAKVQDHYTYVIAGDGCLMEGVSQEAIGLAGRLQLSRLIVLWDDNGITIDGKVSLSDVTDQKARFAASGWDVFACDGHDPEDIDRAIAAAKASPRPAMIACKTHIAIGHAAQDTSKGHGALTDKAQMQAAKDGYGWTSAAFEVPSDVKSWWEEVGAKGTSARTDWEARMSALSPAKQAEFTRIFAGDAPNKLSSTIRAVKKQAVEDLPKLATRAASEKVLAAVNPVMTETIGGSADLTGSNNTKTADMGVFTPEDRKGRYVYYGIREHGMAAAMNGLALHGGVRAYGGTFMCFTDYARPSMRLSALMGVPVVYVMTHDSIGLGEDGPTHQSVEHAASLRLIPNLDVWRPADTAETAVAWAVALENASRPTALLLSRQNLPYAPKSDLGDISKGAYVLAEPSEVGLKKKAQAVIIATGSEVQLALKAQELLAKEHKIAVRVVSMPSTTTFDRQSAAFKASVLPAGVPRVAVEMGSTDGWWKYGVAAVVGLDTYGESAPAPVLFEHFGFTPANVADTVRAVLAK
ncbi:MAG: transketolase [Pseudotabrizicola sp.]|uniref:transketolase n=1 Tax=Pseudotabrizicola sp. TaxID=2939647 RepID=UPI0027163607|nr:transketolase [Pseudotabrizicola sp.]MDO9638546.1 transketolase [Pseudotabrizicola sp.]